MRLSFAPLAAVLALVAVAASSLPSHWGGPREGLAQVAATEVLPVEGSPVGGDPAVMPAARRIEFVHRAAEEVLPYLRPLLGPRGRLEVDRDDNALHVEDRGAIVERIARLAATLDRPAAALQVEIQIVRAAPSAERAPRTAGKLSAPILKQLNDLLRYETYHLLAKTRFTVREGEDVAYQIGDFGVSFRVGLAFEERVKLQGFRVVRDPGKQAIESQLVHSTLTPWLDRPMVLGLSTDEGAGRALMVIVHCIPSPE